MIFMHEETGIIFLVTPHGYGTLLWHNPDYKTKKLIEPVQLDNFEFIGWFNENLR
jgi:hypothetical protein